MPKKPNLVKLSETENAVVYTMAKNIGYTDKQIRKIYKLFERQRHTAKDVDYFLNKEFKEAKIVKILDLSEAQGIDTLKETNSFIKLSGKAKPKKVNDRMSQFNRAVTQYGNYLKNIKKRKWDPETKSIEIPLEGGGKKLMTFKNEEKFNEWKQADIDNVSEHIEHDKGEVKHFETIKKFKAVLR